MDQEKIGQFIQTQRKLKNQTQKELADLLGVSDKTVSKWENGNSMPDISLVMKLCEILEISVNELLSGEHLPSEVYTEKAEENIMTLWKKNEQNEKKTHGMILAGIVFAVFGCCMLIIGNFGISGVITMRYFNWYFDGLTIVVEALLVMACILLSGAGSGRDILKVAEKTILPVGAVVVIFQMINVFMQSPDQATLTLNLAIVILPIMYAFIAYVILITINHRIQEINK